MRTQPHDSITTAQGTTARVRARGWDVLSDPALNRGCAFTPEQRRDLGLIGLLPDVVSSLDAQLDHCYDRYRTLTEDQQRWAYLADLRDRNEVLFHRLIAEYVAETAPVLRGPALERRRPGARPPRAVYLSVDHPEDVEAALRNTALEAADIDLLTVTDSVGPSGGGAHGADRIHQAVGTAALHTAAAGIPPRRALPVLLDAGTDDVRRLTDPSYPGARHAAVRGDAYDRLVDAFVAAATKLWPDAVLCWQGLDPAAGERLLGRYAGDSRVYDDDLQGRAAVALATVLTAAQVSGRRLAEQQVVVYGAGMLAHRVADVLREAMTRQGTASGDAPDRVRLVGPDGLADVVAGVRPSTLVGVSGQPGAFTESLVGQLADQHRRPVILPLSRGNAEATAADLLRWTDGRALVATGDLSPPVTHRRRTLTVASADTALVSSGICLGAVVARAARITDDMIGAAAAAVAGLVDVDTPGAARLPPLSDVRRVSATVAVAVARAAERAGVARTELPDVIQQVHGAMWRPHYPEIEAVES